MEGRNNKGQVAALSKRILGCLSKICNKAVRGDMGLEPLRGQRDGAKLKWWCKFKA